MFHQWQTIWNFYFFWKHIKQTIVKNSSQNVPSLLPVTGRSVVTDAIDSGDDGTGNDVTSVIRDDGSCDDVIIEVVKAGDCEEAKAC